MSRPRHRVAALAAAGSMVLALLLTGCGQAPASRVIALHVVAGQSNALGQKGDGAHYPADPAQQDAHIPFWNVHAGAGTPAGKWTTLGPQPGLFPAGYFGPEVTFIRRLAAGAQRPVALYKFARGSSSIAQFWKTPGTGGGYDRMVADLKTAIAALEKSTHRTVRLASFTWIQGESDATPEFAPQYQARLQAIIDDFRRHVAHDDQLPVILGVDEQHKYVQAHPLIVAAQQALVQRDRHGVWTSMRGLSKADGTHLTPAGLAAHGERLYAAYQGITQ